MRTLFRLSGLPQLVALVSFFGAGTLCRADHHENWMEIKSPHFTVYSNAGEHEGRRVALEFEEIRAMFEQAFPKLKVDGAGKPTIIYALKNEDSLKLFLPTYGQNKNAMKIGGQYYPSYDKNFALVRTDITGTGSSAYHIMYHEYAHGLFRQNFRGLPLWLDEGLAEYWGYSDIENKEAVVGMADARNIGLLQRSQLLPIATLVSIDGSSPLYNTQDHSGIFYAESWALVHYLSMEPGVREQNLLNKFLAKLQQSDDPIEAANSTFGDLQGLGEKLELYVRRQAFYNSKVKLNSDYSEKTFAVRPLSPAEGLVHQADYLLHSNHLPEAIGVLHEAEQLDGKAPGLHDALGYYHFLKADYDNAEKEFALALEANPNDATVYHYRASLLYRRDGYSKETTPQIISNLEKTLTLQPNFAPAYAFLCMAYIATPDQKPKAVEAAMHARELEPGSLAYYIDYGRALLANGKQGEAKMIAERAEKTSTLPRDRALAVAFSKSVNNGSSAQAQSVVVTLDAVPGASPGPAAGSPAADKEYSEQPSVAEGKITELLCGHPPAVMFTLTTASEQILFQVKDVGKVDLKDAASARAFGLPACADWKDRKARVSYWLTPDGPAHGEVSAIAFE